MLVIVSGYGQVCVSQNGGGTNTTCPSGYYFNTNTNTCYPNSTYYPGYTYGTSCGSGYYYNTNTNSCYPNYSYGCSVNCGTPYYGGGYSYGYNNYNYGYSSYGYPYYQQQGTYYNVPNYYYPSQPQTTITGPQISIEQPGATRTVYVQQGTQTTNVQTQPSSNVIVASANILDVYNISIRTDLDGNTIIAWDNNVPTLGEVVFGLTSQPVDGLARYSYDFTTGGIGPRSAHHEANLGKLELNRAYYLRIISQSENASDVSSEIAYIPVPGKHVTPDSPTTLASASTVFGVITLRGLILLGLTLILIVLVYVAAKRRASYYS